VEWQPVPEEFRNGIITKYVIFYTVEKETFKKEVSASLLKAVINGLRQSTTYSFRVQAATVKGAGPLSSFKNVTTKDPPTDPTETKDEGTVGTSKTIVVLATVLGLLVLVVVVVVGGVVVWRRLHRNGEFKLLSAIQPVLI